MSGFDVTTVPLEIWLKVFQSSLEPKQIVPITLCCRSFRQLAQPLLFATFSAALPSPSSHSNSLRQAPRMQRFSRRLEFFSSKDSSRMVRRISIHRDLRHGSLRSFVDNWQWAFFENLHRFHNARSIDCEGLILTANNLRQFSALPYLTHVALRLCSTESSLGPHKGFGPRLRSVVIDDDNGKSIDGYASEWWTPMIRESALERIKCTPRNASVTLLSLLSFGPIMENLRVLELHYLVTRHPNYLVALANCPHVETLGLIAWPLQWKWQEGLVEPLPAGTLPRLQSITAPHQYVLAYSRGRPIRRVTINDPLPEGSSDFVTSLYDTCPKLAHFTVARLETHIFYECY